MRNPPASVAGAACGRTARLELSAREAARLSATRTTGASVAAGDGKFEHRAQHFDAHNLRHTLRKKLQ
jgi:hypothetical protein